MKQEETNLVSEANFTNLKILQKIKQVKKNNLNEAFKIKIFLFCIKSSFFDDII